MQPSSSPDLCRHVLFDYSGGMFSRCPHQVLASIIYSASVLHTAVNYPQRTSMSFVPSCPGSMYVPIPTDKVRFRIRDMMHAVMAMSSTHDSPPALLRVCTSVPLLCAISRCSIVTQFAIVVFCLSCALSASRCCYSMDHESHSIHWCGTLGPRRMVSVGASQSALRQPSQMLWMHKNTHFGRRKGLVDQIRKY